MKNIMYISLLFLLFGCAAEEQLITVNKVDFEQYTGTWYEIARLPNKFEEGLTCVTATYSVMEEGKLKVVNQGKDIETQRWETAEGWAKVPNTAVPGKLKVTFFWPFVGDYYIMHVDEEYNYALVGSPSRDYLWILSREKELDEGIYNELLQMAKDRGFDTNLVQKVGQGCVEPE